MIRKGVLGFSFNIRNKMIMDYGSIKIKRISVLSKRVRSVIRKTLSGFYTFLLEQEYGISMK